MGTPEKRVKNVAINKKVTIIVRQMINASVSVQYLCFVLFLFVLVLFYFLR